MELEHAAMKAEKNPRTIPPPPNSINIVHVKNSFESNTVSLKRNI
jgi:hypothetical protein